MLLRAVIHEFGDAHDVVKIEKYSPSTPTENQVRIRMIVRAINPSDLLTISGAYRTRTHLPFFPGYEGVGLVEDLGTGVTEITKGMRVIPIGSAGAWQEVRNCDAVWCLPVSKDVDDEQAAMSYINPMTAWVMLHEVAKVKPGARIAVTAAGSSIGKMIIKLANIAGLRPVGVLRSERAAHNISELSVDVIRSSDYSNCGSIGELRSTEEVDVIFDCVGGEGILGLANILRHKGMFIHYGLLSGVPIPSTFWLARPDIVFKMFHLRDWIQVAGIAKVKTVYVRVSTMIANGDIHSNVRRRYRLSEIKDALREATTPLAEGKVLLTQ